MNVDLAGFQALLVDWDGTCVESQNLNFAALRDAVAAVAGVNIEDAWYRARLGTSVSDLLDQLDLAWATNEVLVRCQAELVARVGELQVFPQVVTLVERARSLGLACAVASGGGGVVVRAGIAATGLAHLFDHVVVREDVPNGKPAPDLFLEAARRLGVDPGDCLVLEDADEGLAAARAAGMAAVDVRTGQLSFW